MNWQRSFAEHVTGIAFSIQLSKAQVRALGAIADDTWQDGSFHMFFATAGVLKRRGLCEFNEQWKGREGAPWRWRLTPAGEKVLDLIKMATATPVDEGVSHEPA